MKKLICAAVVMVAGVTFVSAQSTEKAKAPEKAKVAVEQKVAVKAQAVTLNTAQVAEEKRKIEAQEAYGIRFPSLKFGQDNRKIIANISTNEINQSMQILKGFGNAVGEKFYQLSTEFVGNDFLELLIYAEENGYLSAKWDSLIKINYFDKFGKNEKLYNIYKEFTEGENKYQKTLCI